MREGNPRVMMLFCPTCGGRFPEYLESDPARCRCFRARSRTISKIQEYDPNWRMTLRSMTGLHPSMSRARQEGIEALSAKRRHGIFLFGPPGIGKTHLLIGLARLALDAGMVATWENFPNLVRRIQDTYDPSPNVPEWEKSRRKIIASLVAHDVVALDDLGRERDTPDVRSITYELVDELYMRRRTVLLATNLELATYEERYDDALKSRLAHMTKKLKVEGEDRRRKEAYA